MGTCLCWEHEDIGFVRPSSGDPWGRCDVAIGDGRRRDVATCRARVVSSALHVDAADLLVTLAIGDPDCEQLYAFLTEVEAFDLLHLLGTAAGRATGTGWRFRRNQPGRPGSCEHLGTVTPADADGWAPISVFVVDGAVGIEMAEARTRLAPFEARVLAELLGVALSNLVRRRRDPR